jgi:hypothetical protein
MWVRVIAIEAEHRNRSGAETYVPPRADPRSVLLIMELPITHIVQTEHQ